MMHNFLIQLIVPIIKLKLIILIVQQCNTYRQGCSDTFVYVGLNSYIIVGLPFFGVWAGRASIGRASILWCLGWCSLFLFKFSGNSTDPRRVRRIQTGLKQNIS